MPRKTIAVQTTLTATKAGLAEKLAAELKSAKDFGQPLVYEQEYSTKKVRVTVIWDEWADASLEERSAVIMKAYEIAEGAGGREKIALASGLTVPEATAAGLLPFQVFPGLRKTDPIKPEQVREIMLEQGASKLSADDGLQLRFATKEEAEACRDRLIRKLPASEPIWIISRDLNVQDYQSLSDSVSAEVK
jgi:hypothetical protein